MFRGCVKEVSTQGVGWASEGTNTSFRYSEEFHIASKVLLVDRSCVGDEADLVYLPALPLYHRADGAAEGIVLVLGCFLGPDKVMFTTI